MKATLRQPWRTAASAIASGPAAAARVSTSRDLLISQFWQNLHARLHPAVPKERPRSLYALTRDVAVAASTALLDRYPDIAVDAGAEPELRSLRLGDMHTCWSLPVRCS